MVLMMSAFLNPRMSDYLDAMFTHHQFMASGTLNIDNSRVSRALPVLFALKYLEFVFVTATTA